MIHLFLCYAGKAVARRYKPMICSSACHFVTCPGVSLWAPLDALLVCADPLAAVPRPARGQGCASLQQRPGVRAIHHHVPKGMLTEAPPVPSTLYTQPLVGLIGLTTGSA